MVDEPPPPPLPWYMPWWMRFVPPRLGMKLGLRAGVALTAARSRKLVVPFVQDHRILTADLVRSVHEFENFQAFLTREHRPELGWNELGVGEIGFPAEGRHLGIPDLAEAKGLLDRVTRLDLEALFGDADVARWYRHATGVLTRLSIFDSHRFYFPCANEPSAAVVLPGRPRRIDVSTLRDHPDLLWESPRSVTALHSAMGDVLMFEFAGGWGGNVVQSHLHGVRVERGEEKGYFPAPGAAILLLFPPGKVELAPDLVRHGRRHIEVYARRGELLGWQKA
jgi:phosphatidylserine decarboxylase